MARIEIVDQSLRDGQQSYWGMRMRAGQILPVADAIDSAGYRVVDLTGSSIFEVMVALPPGEPLEGARRDPRRPAAARPCAPAPGPTASSA